MLGKILKKKFVPHVTPSRILRGKMSVNAEQATSIVHKFYDAHPTCAALNKVNFNVVVQLASYALQF